MSARSSPPIQFGMLLAVLNLLSWAGWFVLRAPASPTECAVLRARRDEQDLTAATDGFSLGGYLKSERLLFGRPLHPAASEPPLVRALTLVNLSALAGAWAFVVPAQSSTLGPTCGESWVCGVLFLLLGGVQWFLVGAALGYGVEAFGGRR